MMLAYFSLCFMNIHGSHSNKENAITTVDFTADHQFTLPESDCDYINLFKKLEVKSLPTEIQMDLNETHFYSERQLQLSYLSSNLGSYDKKENKICKDSWATLNFLKIIKNDHEFVLEKVEGHDMWLVLFRYKPEGKKLNPDSSVKSDDSELRFIFFVDNGAKRAPFINSSGLLCLVPFKRDGNELITIQHSGEITDDTLSEYLLELEELDFEKIKNSAKYIPVNTVKVILQLLASSQVSTNTENPASQALHNTNKPPAENTGVFGANQDLSGNKPTEKPATQALHNNINESPAENTEVSGANRGLSGNKLTETPNLNTAGTLSKPKVVDETPKKKNDVPSKYTKPELKPLDEEDMLKIKAENQLSQDDSLASTKKDTKSNFTGLFIGIVAIVVLSLGIVIGIYYLKFN